jgi:hypothetical protein
LFELVRKGLGVKAETVLRPEVIQVTALIAFYDFASIRGEQTPDSINHQLACLICTDHLEGKLRARRIIASLIERGVIYISESHIHLNGTLNGWVSGGHPLCVPRLSETDVRCYINRVRAKAEAGKKVTQPVPVPIASPQELYLRLKEFVYGQDEACRVLATRGWLHFKRAELLRRGQQVGTNECLFFISQQSGVGKTFLAENYGRLCSLPFTSFSST